MPKPIVILGAGATGLTAALLAARAGQRVVVLEGGDQPGGLLSTFPIGGSRLEHYYHHFFIHDTEIRWLISELGLEEHLRFLPGTMGVFRDGSIQPFNGPRDLLRFRGLSFVAKARFGLSSAFLGKFADWRRREDQPALEWFNRYAGRAATAAIWKPMLEIKFGPFANRVPIAWMVGRLRQRMNSRERGDEKLGYLSGSLQVLLNSLAGRLSSLGVEIVTRARIESLVVQNGRLQAVCTTAGEFEGSAFLSTIPTVHLAPLVAPVDPTYASALDHIEYFGAVCTILEMDRPLSDIYWLNVAEPRFPFGGVIEHTNFIAPANYGGRHIAYLSRYFERTNWLASASPDEIRSHMIGSLQPIYPAMTRDQIVQAHVFRTLTAATVCDLGFSAKVPRMRSPIEGLTVASMAHVYPDERSCNNSIRVAAEACRVMGIEGAAIPRGPGLAGLIGVD